MKQFYKSITAIMLVCLIGAVSVIGASAACTERVIYHVGSNCNDNSDNNPSDSNPEKNGGLYSLLKRYGCSDEQCKSLSDLLKACGFRDNTCAESCDNSDNTECPESPTEPASDITDTEPTKPVEAPSVPAVPSAPASDPTAPVPADTPTETPQPSTLSEYELEVVRLINDIRRQNGLKELKVNEELSRVARIKSQDMHDKGYFSHNSPTYGSPFEMMTAFGIRYRTAGENIAMGYRTPQSVVDGWMNSPGHRANILSANFAEIGMGYVANGSYWTQMFIG